MPYSSDLTLHSNSGALALVQSQTSSEMHRRVSLRTPHKASQRESAQELQSVMRQNWPKGKIEKFEQYIAGTTDELPFDNNVATILERQKTRSS